MPRSEDVAIPMPQNIDELGYRIGDAEVLEGMNAVKPRVPFATEVVDFLHCFSKILLRDGQAREHSDVISLAFWCRKAALENMKQQQGLTSFLLGRGVAFHVAPSNVAVNFAYSLVAGLLTGNANIVRLPSRPFIQVDIICRAFAQALQEHEAMRPYICLVEYGHQPHINNALSALSHARLIWGGDKTIALLRQSPLRPRAVDIAFADRYSIAVISAEHYLAAENKVRVAEDFYNDTLLSDQQACTAPKLVVWLGEGKAQAQRLFWQHFQDYLVAKKTPEAVTVVRNLAHFCEQVLSKPALKYIPASTSQFFRVNAPSVDVSMLESHPGGGYFYEWLAEDINDIAAVCGEKCQTMATFGLSARQAQDFIEHNRPCGVDRIVPLGQTMNFSLRWDGYDLLQTLTRTVTLPANE